MFDSYTDDAQAQLLVDALASREDSTFFLLRTCRKNYYLLTRNKDRLHLIELLKVDYPKQNYLYASSSDIWFRIFQIRQGSLPISSVPVSSENFCSKILPTLEKYRQKGCLYFFSLSTEEVTNETLRQELTGKLGYLNVR